MTTISPSDIECLWRVTENGLFLRFPVPRRWWQFWRPAGIEIGMTRDQAIRFYQTFAKMSRPWMVQTSPADDYNEFADDVMRAVTAADQDGLGDAFVPLGRADRWFEYVAAILQGKGYTKL